jgi:hypothetical protein
MSVTPLFIDTLWRTSWQAGVLVWPQVHPRLSRGSSGCAMALWWIMCARFVIGLAGRSHRRRSCRWRRNSRVGRTTGDQPVRCDHRIHAATTTIAGEPVRLDRRMAGLLVSMWLLGLVGQHCEACRQWRAARTLVFARSP